MLHRPPNPDRQTFCPGRNVSPPSPAGKVVQAFIAGVLVVVLLSVRAGAAPVEMSLKLRNGDSVSGEVLAESVEGVTLKHPILGVIRVLAADIAQKTTLGPAGGAVAVSVPSPTAAPAPGTAPVAKPALPATAAAPPAPKPKRWHFDLQAGIDLGFSVTDRQLYNVRAKADYSYERLRNSLDYMFTFGTTDGIKSADRMDAMVKSDLEIGSRFFLYNLGGLGYDDTRKVNLRYEVGPGIGYHLIREAKLKANVELGGNYQVYNFQDGEQSDAFFYRISEDAVWQVTQKLSLDQKLEFFPGIQDMDRFRVRFEGNVRYALKSNLYINVTALDVYDNKPATGVAKNDLQLRSSVGLKF